MRFNDKARLDTSQVQDQRDGGGGGGGGGFGFPRGGGGGGGGGLPIPGGMGGMAKGGGLGVLLLLAVLVFTQCGGSGASSSTGSGGNMLSQMLTGGEGAPTQADNTQLAANCKTGADANANTDCALVAIINSVQAYWTAEFQASGLTYEPTDTIWFTGQVQTGCGAASAGVGPFYCPADRKVYVDLSFFQTLKNQFRANDEIFTQAYVLSHEYGHHVQNLLGTSSRIQQGDSGPTSGSVRLELQADCYAGTWANHATTTPGADGQVLITEINQADLDAALNAASHIGDDYIMSNLGGGNNPSQYTHGTSEQRQKWFLEGWENGNPDSCNTFDTNNLG